MIKHVVMWKLKEQALGKSAEENGLEMRRRLEALPAVIPEIRDFEFGRNFNPASSAYDYCLYSTFADLPALKTYQVHPGHVAVKEFISEVTETAAVVDYET